MFETVRNKAVDGVVSLLERHVGQYDVVLDIMCGSGLTAMALAQRTGCTAWGADLEPHLACNLPYAPLQRAEYTGFAEQAFDVALLRGVLRHLPFALQAELLGEALRVARRVLVLERPPGMAARVVDYAGNLARLHKKSFGLSYRTLAGWGELASQLGEVTHAEGAPAAWGAFMPPALLLQVERVRR